MTNTTDIGGRVAATDVARFDRNFQEVVYTVGPDTVRKAILVWLESEHNGVFTDETTVRFCAGDSLAVATRFVAHGGDA